MSASRYMTSIHPKEIEQQHRLHIYHREKKVVPRDKKKKLTGQSKSSETTEDVDKTRPSSWLSSNAASENDLSHSEDEVFSECQTPVTDRNDTTNSVVKDYESACKLYDTLQLTCITNGLLQKCLTCKSFQLQTNDCKAICNALLNNRFVERLEFQDNGMGPAPAYYFADVIQESVFLTHISLADNDLRSEGAKVICKAVSMNPGIVYLDLSGNGLVESDGACIRKLIKDSNTLRELYLAKNKLMDVGVRHIVKGLECTTTLNVLDLSWNHIRLKGASAICKVLENNSSLHSINLAWNGLHRDGAKSLSLALQKNKMLKEIDISCNRLSEGCIAEILKGLRSNTTLETLRMGLNHVTPTAALNILQKIHDNKTSGIKLLDLGNQEVYDKFEELSKALKKERNISVVYGSVRNSDRTSFIKRPSCDKELMLLTYDPLTVLMECMRLQNMRLLEFFKWLDADNNKHICINELCDGMMKIGIPLRRHTLLRLLHRLDLDKNNVLDFREMTSALNLHRENVRNILAESTGVDFEQTEIGKVSSLIKKFMDKSTALKKAEHNAKMRRSSVYSTLLPLMKKDRRKALDILPEPSDEESLLNTHSKQILNSVSAEMSRASNTSTSYSRGSNTSPLETTGTASMLSTVSHGRTNSSPRATHSSAIEKSATKDETKSVSGPSIETLSHNAGTRQKMTLKFPEIEAKPVLRHVWESAF